MKFLILSMLLTPMIANAGFASFNATSRTGNLVAGKVSQVGKAEIIKYVPVDPAGHKVKLESVNAKGDCPSGATKLEKCSGVYANGNSWEISPCCKTVTD